MYSVIQAEPVVALPSLQLYIEATYIGLLPSPLLPSLAPPGAWETDIFFGPTEFGEMCACTRTASSKCCFEFMLTSGDSSRSFFVANRKSGHDSRPSVRLVLQREAHLQLGPPRPPVLPSSQAEEGQGASRPAASITAAHLPARAPAT